MLLGIFITKTSDRIRGLADIEISKAEGRAAEANVLAKGFEAQIASANARAAEATALAESEMHARIKLEALVAPRRLSVEQQRRLLEQWKVFAGKTVRVTSYLRDGEGAALGMQLIQVLRGAGINTVSSLSSVDDFPGFTFGVHVRGVSAEAEFIDGIANGLTSIGGLQVFPKSRERPGGIARTLRSKLPEGAVTIFVGIKPISVELHREQPTA